MIPVPIINMITVNMYGHADVWYDRPPGPKYGQSKLMQYRMVDGDPTNLEVVE